MLQIGNIYSMRSYIRLSQYIFKMQLLCIAKAKHKMDIKFTLKNDSCNSWIQNINTLRRLIVLQKGVLQIINFKDRLSDLSPFFPATNIRNLVIKFH